MADRSPTVDLLVVFAAVFLVERLAVVVGVDLATFALALPVAQRPWTLVTSVYAHGSLGHLLANGVALALIGVFLERRTSNARFHAFVLVTGAAAGLTQVWVAAALGRSVAVLGASGAVFALLGYLLAGNRVTESALDRLPVSPRGQLLGALAVAGALTLATAGPRVALVAHFTGLLLGLLAGRAHLLRP